MPRVSVITPVCNGEKYLDEAIQSVLNQTYEDWELLLIDDGSADESVNIARQYAQRYPTRISYLEHPGHVNRGQFSTRILGAEHARASVIAMLDQDDVWDRDYLAEHLRIWNEVQPHNVFLSYGPSLYWFHNDSTGSKDFVQKMPAAKQAVYAPGVLLESFLSTYYADTPCPSCTLIRREVLCSVRKFEKLAKGSAFEDQYLWWYTAARWPVAVHNNVWVRYRQHSESALIKLNSSPKQTCLAELTFLQTIRDDLKPVCPELSLLTDGRLETCILDLRKRYAQDVLRDSSKNYSGGSGADQKPLVSGIIIFLNGANFLQEAIESVLAQTYEQWELFLVDDGSIDGSSEIAIRYAEQYPDKIRYLEHDGHQNRGKNASRNLGLHHARGKYIALLDHDDIWLPNKLEDQVRMLESLPEAGMMYGRTRYWHSWTGRPEDRERDGFTALGIQPDTLVRPPNLITLLLRDERTTAATCSVLIRREVAECVGGFDETFRDIYEDTLFLTKIYLQFPVFVAGECWDSYRQHPNNTFYSALRTGRWRPKRPNASYELFLNRLEHYISEKGIIDVELVEALKSELRPYRNLEPPTARDKYQDLCWDVALALLRGEDPSPLVRAMGEVRDPGIDGQTVAEWLFEAVPFSTCRAPSVWVELWPEFKLRIEKFFAALELHEQVAGFAAEALGVLERLIEAKWWLRVAEGNVAKLLPPNGEPDLVRIVIEKVQTSATFDIQLNQPRLKVKSNHHYMINFRARAGRPRSIFLGFAKAHEPWDGLGLYKEIELTSEWRSFREEFVATADDDNARIHFDIGNSEIPVELAGVSLHSLPDGQCIKPDLAPWLLGKPQRDTVLLPGVG